MYGCQASAGIRYLDSWRVSALRKVSSWRGGGAAAAVMEWAGAKVQVYPARENLYTLIDERSRWLTIPGKGHTCLTKAARPVYMVAHRE